MSAAAAALIATPTMAAKNISPRASGVVGFHGVKAPAHQVKNPAAPLCGTGFGAELPTPDGLIAWNDTSNGYNTAGGADFKCTLAKTKIKEVDVYGYNAPANPEQYNVTIYKNSGADGTDEPNDSKVKCAYTGVSAEGGGQYPTHTLSHIKLPTACKVKAGHYWVAVQNNDSAGPWYWEMTSTLGGSAQGDWDDVNNFFGSGCTSFNNDEYLQQCLGYTYLDYMLELH
jgi:hypothetical protein